MSLEVIEHEGIRYAEVIWAGTTVSDTVFYSPAGASFQFGLLAHATGFVEPAHDHFRTKREINDMQQMFVVQRGVVGVQLFDAAGKMFREVVLKAGDAVCLVHGTHAVRVIEDMQCVSVKQGPFLGAQMDKVNVEVGK